MDIDPPKIPNFAQFVAALCFAGFGGMAGYLHKIKMDRRHFGAVDMLMSMIVSGFCGVTAFFVCRASGISDAWSAALVGMSGFMGGESLRIMFGIVRRSLYANLPKQGKTDE
jgi:hypothetical protein